MSHHVQGGRRATASRGSVDASTEREKSAAGIALTKNTTKTFIEWKPTTSFTLRAEVNNFDPYRFYINRFIYDGESRAVGDLAIVEQELRKSQVIGRLSARWTFG